MNGLIKAGLTLFAIAAGLPALAWLSCLFKSEIDGKRFYVLAYRMSVVLPLAGCLALAGVIVFVIDYIDRIRGL